MTSFSRNSCRVCATPKKQTRQGGAAFPSPKGGRAQIAQGPCRCAGRFRQAAPACDAGQAGQDAFHPVHERGPRKRHCLPSLVRKSCQDHCRFAPAQRRILPRIYLVIYCNKMVILQGALSREGRLPDAKNCLGPWPKARPARSDRAPQVGFAAKPNSPDIPEAAPSSGRSIPH